VENQDDPKDDSTAPTSDDSPSPAAPEASDARPKQSSGSKSSKAKKRAAARGSSDAKPAKAPPGGMSSSVVIAGLLALAVGGAGGWFGHEAQAKAKLRADSAPAASGSAAASGPCNTWATKVCAGTGEQSAACGEAKAALDLLTPPTCEVALAGVPATLAKVKAGRASCDTLAARLCKDLPPGSAACNIVKERTPSFPSARCDEMLQHYDDVIQELRQLDQQQGMMGMAPPGAAPGAPPGAPPMAPPPGSHP
jgi:hypothetical protein